MNSGDTQAMTGDSPNRVALTVWPWRERMGATPAAKPPHSWATEVVIPTLVGAAIAALLYWKQYPRAAAIVATVTGGLALCSLAWPAGYRGIQRGFKRLGVIAGQIVTHLLLVPCFILIFGSVHLLLSLFRRDPLGYRYMPGRTTYWEDRDAVTDTARHLETPY